MSLLDTLSSTFSPLLDALAASQALWLSPWGLALLGLCIGSFLNVVVHRLPLMLDQQWRAESAELLGLDIPPPVPRAEGTTDAKEEPISLSHPASRCPHCGHVIRWYENIPVISWVVLRARCSGCKAPISARYPAVELATAALFAAMGLHFGATPEALLWCGVVATLLSLALIDWDTTLLPDDLNQPLLWAGLIAAALGWNSILGGGLSSALWGAVAGYLSLWSVTWVFKRITGKIGMGQGDFKLLAALGAWLGPVMILPIVLGASLLGALIGTVMKVTGALREGRYVPFGPFLAGAGLVVLLAGRSRVMSWMGWM